jgi:phosphoglycolate phosphatase-like HAD superfamily hydrolase
MARGRSGKRQFHAVVFDLDQTLIDSSSAESLRKAREWSRVYAMIPRFPVYSGITDLLKWLKASEIPVGIATSSPEAYCKRVVSHHSWPISATSCYHCTTQKKPHPAPIQKVAERLGVDPASVVSIGDDPRDVQASFAAGALAVGASWGCAPGIDLAAEDPDELCETVEDLETLLRSLFPQ